MNSQEPGQRKAGWFRRWIPRILVMGFVVMMALMIARLIFLVHPFPRGLDVAELEQRIGLKLPARAQLLRGEKISCLQDKRLWAKIWLEAGDVDTFVKSLPPEIESSRKQILAWGGWKSWCDPGTPAKYVSFYGCPSAAHGALSGVIDTDDPNNVILYLYFAW